MVVMLSMNSHPHPQILPDVAPLLRVANDIAAERGKSVPQVSINWSICKGVVPLVGSKNVQQVRENLGALGWRLSPGEVAELDRASSGLKRGATQNVFQTG